MAITTMADLHAKTNIVFGGGVNQTTGVATDRINLASGFSIVTTPTPAGGIAYTNWSQLSVGRFPGGQISAIVAPSGAKTYISRASYRQTGQVSQTPILIDLLWASSVDSSGTTLSVGTGLQTINSVAWPARDNNESTNGEGVYFAVFNQTTLGATGGTATISYTNSAGTSGRTGVTNETIGAQTDFHIFGLEAGDLGVRSVQSFQFSVDHVSGTIYLFAFRPIVMNMIHCGSPATLNNGIFDAISMGVPVVFDNSILTHMWVKNSTTNCGWTYYLAQG